MRVWLIVAGSLLVFALAGLGFWRLIEWRQEQHRRLVRKIHAFRPVRRGTSSPPMKLVEQPGIVVKLRQTAEEGVPHILLGDEEVLPELGAGRPPLKPEDHPDPVRFAEEVEAFERAFIAPKIAALKPKVRTLLEDDEALPLQIDAGPEVRHEYVIAILDTFIEVCHDLDIEAPEITFVGSPPPRPR